jgi:hypothetical protein
MHFLLIIHKIFYHWSRLKTMQYPAFEASLPDLTILQAPEMDDFG